MGGSSSKPISKWSDEKKVKEYKKLTRDQNNLRNSKITNNNFIQRQMDLDDILITKTEIFKTSSPRLRIELQKLDPPPNKSGGCDTCGKAAEQALQNYSQSRGGKYFGF